MNSHGTLFLLPGEKPIPPLTNSVVPRSPVKPKGPEAINRQPNTLKAEIERSRTTVASGTPRSRSTTNRAPLDGSRSSSTTSRFQVLPQSGTSAGPYRALALVRKTIDSSTICGRSRAVATVAIRPSPSLDHFGRYPSARPIPATLFQSKAVTSEAGTLQPAPNRPCRDLQCPGFNIAGLRRADLQPAARRMLRPPSYNSPVCAIGVIKCVTALIATISPALAAPPLLPAAASPNTPSFLLSPTTLLTRCELLLRKGRKHSCS